jgi:tellurite resistance protein TehA-like permease
MESGWDPEVKRFFVKIMNSIAFGLMWMMACVTAGLYFELGFITGKPTISNIIFYVCAIGSLFFLLRYLYKIWKGDVKKMIDRE